MIETSKQIAQKSLAHHQEKKWQFITRTIFDNIKCFLPELELTWDNVMAARKAAAEKRELKNAS